LPLDKLWSPNNVSNNATWWQYHYWHAIEI
jgi:hypothetical protein